MVMSGLLIGILLARTVAGLLAEAGSWRVVYFVAAGLMVLQAFVLRARLPRYREQGRTSYRRLLASTLRLLVDERVLRLRALYGLLGFATFSVLWTSVAFLLHDHYHYSAAVIGLFGLIGAAGAVAANVAGTLSDRGLEHVSTGATSALLALSWLPMWLGAHGIGWLILGIVALDVGAQGLHITNQGAIYRLRGDARSRITAAYMVLYFAGGAAGSALSAWVYSGHGWSGVSLVGEAFSFATVVVWAVSRRWRPASRPLPPSRTPDTAARTR
jgi:predicted MFS family arabinose efflux permease